MNKQLYNYETNVKYNSGNIVIVLGATKKELQNYFNDLGVVIGKRIIKRFKYNSDLIPNYLEAQKQLLIKYLKLKKVYIEKEDKNEKGSN